MNFAKWLLKRIHRKMFGGEWAWLFKYRELIQEEIPLAILITVLLGVAWTLAMSLVMIYFIDDRETLLIVMRCVMLCPPLFFVYNWLYTLYEIYNNERMATWDAVRKPE
jgi:hypothetical protein